MRDPGNEVVSTKIQLLNFACIFGIRCCSFTICFLHLQLSIQVSNFSTPIVDLTLFVSRFNFVVLSFQDLSAGTGKLCILGHLGLVFIWSCFVSCLLFLLVYVNLRNLCSGTCKKIQYSTCKFTLAIGQFRIVQQQRNRVEVQGNNLHFPLF